MGGAVFPSCCLTSGQSMVEVMKIMVTAFKRSPPTHYYTQCPDPATGHRRPTPPLETPGHTWASLGQSLWGHCSFLLGPGAQVSVCALLESVSSVLCKLWGLYGGVNGDLLLEGLWHTQVCCTQSPCPCSRPLLTCTFIGDAQTQFCLSLCGVSGSWCAQGLFEPSVRLWWVRSLILNVILPLLPPCWGFSFVLGCGVSFFGGIQHSSVNDYSAASCSFGVLAEEEHTSFYSAMKLKDTCSLKEKL